MSRDPAMNYRALIAWLPCQAFYYVGHAFSRVMDWLPEHEEGGLWDWIACRLYDAYNWNMRQSLRLNDWAGLRVWTTP